MPTEQVLIEFITDDASLQTVEERLLSLGKIDQRSAQIFKLTNDQLKAREGITGKLTEASTREQAIINKLTSSLKNLSGESKHIVENLLKLSGTEIAGIFNKAGDSVDLYVDHLESAEKSTKEAVDNINDLNKNIAPIEIQTPTTSGDDITAKLRESLKSLSGESKKAVEDLLKLPTDEIVKGFDAVGTSVDDYIQKLKKAEGASAPLSKEQVVINKLGIAFLNLKGKSKDAIESLLKLPVEEIVKGFENAGISVDDYIESLNRIEGATVGTGESTKSLKAQLRDMIAELARLKLAGQDNTEQYRLLAAEAGNLSDTLGDTSAEVRRLGSDTGVFDGLIAGAQGLAGGFAIAQGAAALFGASSDEVQETLLRVNSAMAILQGLQQVSTVFESESALAQLASNIQRKITNAQLIIENGLQSRSVVVRLLAAGAQKVLNAAMAANPIGIVIVALTTVIGLFALYANSARKAAEQQAALNGALKESREGLEAEIEGIRTSNKKIVSELEIAGKKKTEIEKANLQSEVLVNESRIRAIDDINKVLAKNRDVTDQDTLDKLKELEKERDDIENKISDSSLDIQLRNNARLKAAREEDLQDAISNKQALLDNILAKGGKNTGKDFEAQKAKLKAESALEIHSAGENAAQIFAIRSKLAKDLHEIDIAARDQKQKDILAQLNLELLAEQQRSQAVSDRTGQKEIEIKQRIILTTSRFESEQEGKSKNERLEIRKNGLKEAADLQKQFSRQSREETLQDIISLNNAQLQNINLLEEEKLSLKIDNIIAAAEVELDQNRGISAKIIEINARRDADIKALRLQSIQDTLDKELAAFEVGFAASGRQIENILSAQDELRGAANSRERKRLEDLLGIKKISLVDEFALIDEQTQHQLDGVRLQKEALKKSFQEGLIVRDNYIQSSNELIDKETQAVENGEKKKRESRKRTAEEQKQLDHKRFETVIDVASQVTGVLSNLYNLQADKENQRISAQRANIQALRESGAITEKDALARLNKVDFEERKIRLKQAQRDKQIALFNAIISTAQAVVKSFADGGPVLAAFAAAVGAAQIAIIASKPIPKFSKGKKDKYEGLGQIGETGSELIERNGEMFITKKPTIVWIGRKDIVYNPKETKEMVNRMTPVVNHQVIVNDKNSKHVPIDYDKLGEAVGKHTSVSLNIDGYKEFIKEHQAFITYLNSRRGF